MPSKGELQMKRATFNKLAAILGVIVLGMGLASQAFADCGNYSQGKSAPSLHKQSWRDDLNPGLIRVSTGSQDPIVGFWQATFTSNDIVIDSTYVQWHSDGTEIMNSSRPPATSNFCLGVWENLGKSKYKLNHFAISSDINGNLIGPANIRELVALDSTGNSYSGKFTIDQYDTNGNLLAHVAGNLNATRITVDTPPPAKF
jgi:hypothetical protein